MQASSLQNKCTRNFVLCQVQKLLNSGKIGSQGFMEAISLLEPYKKN